MRGARQASSGRQRPGQGWATAAAAPARRQHQPATAPACTHLAGAADAARKLCPSHGFQSAKDYEAQRQASIVKISTGCAALDELLGGGVETKAVR